MKLSPHQVRAVLEIKEQTLRYWKQAYPQLAGRRGYGPCYSFGDTLVLLITKRLVENLGVEINKLEPISQVLFDACNASVSLLRSSGNAIFIDLELMTASFMKNESSPPRNISLVLSLHDLAQELQNRIIASIGDDEAIQLPLSLGPTALENKKRAKA